METETFNKYIQVFDMIGHDSFLTGSDDQLKEWGNSEEKIRVIKVNSVKGILNFHEEGIECYKELNKLLGGVNIL